MAHTVVAFHAHPDDEAVLTAGTMAAAAATGHRVVLVLATDGGLGRSDADRYAAEETVAAARRIEARRSAEALGVERLVHLGYADSGPDKQAPPDPPGRTRFVRASIAEAAARLAAILREEGAQVLLGYDRNGGYGHPDHVRVHHVAIEAARLAGTPKLLQATAPRDTLCRGIDLLAALRCLPSGLSRPDHARFYSARSEITHRIPVRRYAARKRASLRAHASQTSRRGADRMLAAFLRIPRPLFDVAFGREWFIDPDHRGPVARDVFAGLP